MGNEYSCVGRSGKLWRIVVVPSSVSSRKCTTPSVLDFLPDDHAHFIDQLTVAAFASVMMSESQEPFSSTGTEVRAWGAGELISLIHQLFIMPAGPHRIEGGSCVPGGGSGIFDPTVQNSHLPGLIASSAPAAHAHTSATRMRIAVAPTTVAARIFASAPSACCGSAH